jgi:hypothetical protein
MMLGELQCLLSVVESDGAVKSDYLKAIKEDNCLGKRSVATRNITGRHLVELYALDSSVTLFRALLYFWKRDAEGQPLLVLLCAYSRDPLLRASAEFISRFGEGAVVGREDLEEFIDTKYPSRFSEATLKSTAQNVRSTWTQSGHLRGKVEKIRSKACATPGAVSYALFLGYLVGIRGNALFTSDYAKLLDCSAEQAIDLAHQAAQRGWITFKRLGNVMEVLFRDLLTTEEVGWLGEQD